MLADVINPSMQEDYKDINYTARKLGIDYMKKTVPDVVKFLEDRDETDEITRKLKTDYATEGYGY